MGMIINDSNIENNNITGTDESGKLSNFQGGWIKLFRKITEWEWFTDPNVLQLFIFLLVKANHSPKKWQGKDIGRGQLITSVASISNETKLSNQAIRTALGKLIRSGDITKKSTNKFTLITVLKYDVYQGFDTINQQANQQANQQTNNKRTTTNNNNKNYNNEKNNNTFDFKKAMLDYGFDENLTDEWLEIRKKKKAINTERSYKMFISEFEKTGKKPDEVLEIIVKRQWKGFEKEWISTPNNSNKTGNQLEFKARELKFN